VAKSNLGKSVSRAGALGGGKTNQKARPNTFNAIIVIIIVLGLVSVVYSRYERQNPASASTEFPKVGDTGFVALAGEECGVYLPTFKPVTDSSGTYTIQAHNVLKVSPLTQSQAGANATVAAFINQTEGFSFSTQKVTFPGPTGKATAATTYNTGDKCSSGTRYNGQTGSPVIAYWTSAAQAQPKTTTDPSSVHFTNYLLLTIAFVPKGVLPIRPSTATIAAMYAAVPPSTTTTLPGTTSTTLPVTTTTAPTTTTTKPKG
jgi:hypothetical protein